MWDPAEFGRCWQEQFPGCSPPCMQLQSVQDVERELESCRGALRLLHLQVERETFRLSYLQGALERHQGGSCVQPQHAGASDPGGEQGSGEIRDNHRKAAEQCAEQPPEVKEGMAAWEIREQPLPEDKCEHPTSEIRGQPEPPGQDRGQPQHHGEIKEHPEPLGEGREPKHPPGEVIEQPEPLGDTTEQTQPLGNITEQPLPEKSEQTSEITEQPGPLGESRKQLDPMGEVMDQPPHTIEITEHQHPLEKMTEQLEIREQPQIAMQPPPQGDVSEQPYPDQIMEQLPAEDNMEQVLPPKQTTHPTEVTPQLPVEISEQPQLPPLEIREQLQGEITKSPSTEDIREQAMSADIEEIKGQHPSPEVSKQPPPLGIRERLLWEIKEQSHPVEIREQVLPQDFSEQAHDPTEEIKEQLPSPEIREQLPDIGKQSLGKIREQSPLTEESLPPSEIREQPGNTDFVSFDDGDRDYEELDLNERFVRGYLLPPIGRRRPRGTEVEKGGGRAGSPHRWPQATGKRQSYSPRYRNQDSEEKEEPLARVITEQPHKTGTPARTIMEQLPEKSPTRVTLQQPHEEEPVVSGIREHFRKIKRLLHVPSADSYHLDSPWGSSSEKGSDGYNSSDHEDWPAADFNYGTESYDGDGHDEPKLAQEGSETMPYIDESPTMSPQLSARSQDSGDGGVSPTPTEVLVPGK